MKVAILHYHLNPGGVTRIIASQIQGIHTIAPEPGLVVLCGDSANQTSLSGIPVREHTCLRYMKPGKPGVDFEKEAFILKSYIKEQAGGYILHCHNPNLGKNPALTLAIYQLAKEGYRILNHCHDFAEDRPPNMEFLNEMISQTGLDSDEIMYPDLPDYHFVVLNTCDYERIINKGIPAHRVHLLPNPVSMGKFEPGKDKRILRSEIIGKLGLEDGKMVCTYPVRGIKRKNLGEFILLSVLFESSCRFVITQAPLNPDEISGYIRWKDFCDKHRIRINFEAGNIVNHEELIGISDFCITTSTREGFGMVYLEPWLAGTPVSGRDLPCITGDLRKYGLEFPGLYDRFLIQTGAGSVDFKDLEVEQQEDFIIRAQISNDEKEKLFRLNPFLGNLFNRLEAGIVERNRQIIINEFSVPDYGKRLFALYKNFSR